MGALRKKHIEIAAALRAAMKARTGEEVGLKRHWHCHIHTRVSTHLAITFKPPFLKVSHKPTSTFHIRPTDKSHVESAQSQKQY